MTCGVVVWCETRCLEGTEKDKDGQGSLGRVWVEKETFVDAR